MSALPIMEIRDRIINNSPQDYKSQEVSLNAHCQSGSRRFVIVTEKGIIDEPLIIASSFPDWGDISGDPKDYPEDWVCIESERFATGVIGWHHAEEILLDDYWTSLTFNVPEVKRQSHTDLPPIYFYAGEGGWRTVRHYWQKLIRGDIEEEKELEAEGVIQIGFDHNPLVIERGNNEVQLTVNNRRIIELNGELKLEAPEGIALSEDKLTLEGINLNKSFSKRLTLKCNDNDLPSRVYMIKKAEFNIKEERRIIEIDNGSLTMKSAPDYKGSIFSIERNGIERILSSFPKPGNFGQERPWYGGIQPVIHGESFQLHKEKFAYEIVEKIGLQGVEWRGVKVLCEPEHRLYRWLRLETEYLTASDSDIIAIISRYINKTTASQKFNGGIRIFLRIGCERDSILHFQRDGKSYRKKRTNRYASGVNCGSWAALENPKTNELEIIVVARGIDIFAFDYSEDLGMHPTISKEFTLKPEEAKEIVSYLIIRDNKINPEDYSVMTNLRELP
jgi:hypothetical protein